MWNFEQRRPIAPSTAHIVAVAVALFVWAGLVSNSSAQTATVQSGMTTFASVSTDVSIASLNLTTSFLIFSYTIDDVGPSQFLVGGDLTSPTNIHFERVGASGSPVVSGAWYVAESTSDVTAQRGNNPHNSATVNVPITTVDLSESFPLISGQNNGSTWGSDDDPKSRLMKAVLRTLAQG